MYRNLPKKGKITAAFVMILLLITLISSLLPNVTAASVVVVSVTPESGNVGDAVRVIGQIDTTNGSYAIFFDEEIVKNGTAVETMVNDTFNVPPRSMGGHDITLHDISTTNNATSEFTIETAYFIKAIVPSPPEQLQEGESTEIQVKVTGGTKNTFYGANITVTNPLGMVYYNDTLQLTNTTNTGYGEGSVTYPTDFGANAHTNYTGTYEIAFNETLAIGNFTVGLTDRAEYRRSFEGDLKYVHIRGSGYEANETVTINIMTAGTSITGYPENKNATNGVIVDSWKIPENATGIYTVTLTNATSLGTDKPVPDAQNFTVIDIIIHCQAQNRYDKKPLANVSVEVYVYIIDITSGKTNKTGWTDFRLDRGDYTFKAFWNEELVGSLNGSVAGDVTDFMLQRTFYIECELAHITIAINDEAGNPLPFINVNLTSSKPETLLFETNSTGIIATNTFTNVSYTIESRRYDCLFDTTPIKNLTYTLDGKDRINITCPTYNLFVYVLDSKEHALKNVGVTVYEWSSERIVGSGSTDPDFGSIAFNCTFGRYKIKVDGTEWGRKVVLNETVMDLIEDRFFFVVHCMISNLDPSVKVVDYFGQPIPNAEVKLERKFDEEYVNVANLTTESDGTAQLPKTGGDYRVSVHVMGEYCEARPIHLSESKAIEFKIDKYVTLGGYPIQTTQLIAYISLTLLIATFALAITYRRLWKTIKKEKTSPKD